MNKKKIKPYPYLYPMPTILVGANIDKKANFITVGFCGILEYDPLLFYISLVKNRFTSKGIKDNGTFSVNFPSSKMVEITDFVGLTSGNKIDKSKLFEIFYGNLKTAPMIEEAPLNHECQLVKTIDFSGKSEIFVGEIKQTYITEDCLTDGKIDTNKLDPIIFSVADLSYWQVGNYLGKAYKIGKKYNNKRIS